MNRLRTFSNSWSSWRSFSESSAVEEIVNDSLLDDNDDDDELWGVEEELKEGEGVEGKGLALEIWRSGAWRVYPVLFFLMLSYSIILPLLPQLCTNEFASSSAGKQCSFLPPLFSLLQLKHSSSSLNFSSSTTSSSSSRQSIEV